MCTFPLKAHHKAIKIFAVGTRLQTTFSHAETTTSDKSWAGNDDEVSEFNITVIQIFYWTVGKV